VECDRCETDPNTVEHKDSEESEYCVGGLWLVAGTVNGQLYHLTLDPRTSLLDLLREHIRLTGKRRKKKKGLRSRPVRCLHDTGRRTPSHHLMFDAGPSCMTGTTSSPSRASAPPMPSIPLQAAFIERDAFSMRLLHSGSDLFGRWNAC